MSLTADLELINEMEEQLLYEDIEESCDGCIFDSFDDYDFDEYS